MDEPRDRDMVESTRQRLGRLLDTLRRSSTDALVALRTLLVRSGRTSRSSDWGEQGGIRLARAETIDAEPEGLYGLWRDLGRLPDVMTHVERVEALDGRVSRWQVAAPGGGSLSFTAAIVADEPAERIAWRSLPGSDVRHEGEVRFRPAPAGKGTEVHVSLRYWPPGGRLGATLARFLGEEPRQQLADDLRHLRQFVETGALARSDGAPSGRRLPQVPGQPPVALDA